METLQMVVFCCKTVRNTRGQKMAVRSTQCQNKAVRSTQGGKGVSPSFIYALVNVTGIILRWTYLISKPLFKYKKTNENMQVL